MTPADVSADSAPKDTVKDPEAVPHFADRAKAEAMRANMSAIVTADVGDLQTTGSAIGVATVGHDLDMTTSAAGLLSVQGDAAIHQAGSWGVFAKGDVSVSQGGSAVVVARDYKVESGAACAVVATEATVSRGWIGFLLAPKATVSDDSRVFIGTTAALIIGGAILLGFGVLAVAGVRTAREAMAWRPKLPGLKWE
jgi:hypothetical protein